LPQINVLVVGFSVNALLTVGCLFVSLGAIAWAFPQETVSAIDLLRDAIRAAASVASPSAVHSA
jgi:flagellar biosynthesis protein FliR